MNINGRNYTNEELNEIANRLDILRVISQHQPCAKRQGRNYFFHCPNRTDTDPSLLVDKENNYYYCFAEAQGGNVISYFCNELGYSFKEAAEEVIRLSGGSYQPIATPECLQVFKRYKRLTEPQAASKGTRVYGDYQRDYADRFSLEPAPEWLAEGISAETMRRYDIRIDHLGERIVYPVYDNEDRYITAKGRTRLKQYKALGIPKYVSYSALGTVDYFAGEKENRQNILKTNSAIIFEGIKSVMKAEQYGFPNCLAAETSCVNKWQIQVLLGMHIRDVTIAFDKDKSLKDALKNTELLRRFVNLYAIIDRENLLKEKDSPVDQGAEVFKKLYERRIRI